MAFKMRKQIKVLVRGIQRLIYRSVSIVKKRKLVGTKGLYSTYQKHFSVALVH